MSAGVLSLFPSGGLEVFFLLGQSDVLVALIFFLTTATLITFCVPGILIPTAVASGALLGTWPAAAAVLAGTLVGSQLLFILARWFGKDWVSRRLGKHLERFDSVQGVHGFWHVAGLRIIGVPHFIVTTGSALTAMKASTFAAATLLGMMPAISLAASAGAAL